MIRLRHSQALCSSCHRRSHEDSVADWFAIAATLLTVTYLFWQIGRGLFW